MEQEHLSECLSLQWPNEEKNHSLPLSLHHSVTQQTCNKLLLCILQILSVPLWSLESSRREKFIKGSLKFLINTRNI